MTSKSNEIIENNKCSPKQVFKILKASKDITVNRQSSELIQSTSDEVLMDNNNVSLADDDIINEEESKMI